MNPYRYILWRLHRWAFPVFECKGCDGVRDCGCECLAYAYAAPGVEAGKLRKKIQRWFEW